MTRRELVEKLTELGYAEVRLVDSSPEILFNSGTGIYVRLSLPDKDASLIEEQHGILNIFQSLGKFQISSNLSDVRCFMDKAATVMSELKAADIPFTRRYLQQVTADLVETTHIIDRAKEILSDRDQSKSQTVEEELGSEL
jgi:hypothetical protein